MSSNKKNGVKRVGKNGKRTENVFETKVKKEETEGGEMGTFYGRTHSEEEMIIALGRKGWREKRLMEFDARVIAKRKEIQLNISTPKGNLHRKRRGENYAQRIYRLQDEMIYSSISNGRDMTNYIYQKVLWDMGWREKRINDIDQLLKDIRHEYKILDDEDIQSGMKLEIARYKFDEEMKFYLGERFEEWLIRYDMDIEVPEGIRCLHIHEVMEERRKNNA